MTSLAAPRFIPEHWVRVSMRQIRRQHVELHRAGAAESGLLRELARAFREEAGKVLTAEESAAIDKLLAQPELGAAYLVSSGVKTVGYIVLCYGFSLEYCGRDAFIDEFYLLPAARGAGTGTKTLALVEREAAHAGVRALHLEVLGDNLRVCELYKRCGFLDRESRMMTRRLQARLAS